MEVMIEFDRIGHRINLLFFSRHSDGKITVVKPVDVVYCTEEEGSEIKPTLKLNYDPQLLQSIAEECSRLGIKTDSDHKIAGTLEATKYHLEDCRKLLKLPGPGIGIKTTYVCKHCGCTDEKACPGGCYWVMPNVCSRCADK